MAVWLIRAGSHGEYEQKFIQDKRVYITWDELHLNIGNLENRQMLTASLTGRYPNAKPNTIRNWTSQLWPFAHDMKKGDLVILPLKSQPAIQVGEITSATSSQTMWNHPTGIGAPSSGSVRQYPAVRRLCLRTTT